MGDCDEGCSDDCHHKWHIEPHPYSNDFDVFVTDDDAEALKVLQEAAGQAWDQCGDGMSRTITIRRRPAQETPVAHCCHEWRVISGTLSTAGYHYVDRCTKCGEQRERKAPLEIGDTTFLDQG